MTDRTFEVSENGEDNHMIICAEQNSVYKYKCTYNNSYNTSTY
jgi:hypothetical protein